MDICSECGAEYLPAGVDEYVEDVVEDIIGNNVESRKEEVYRIVVWGWGDGMGLFGKKKVEGKTKDADAWYNKGKALQNLGRYEEAIRCYDKVIEINPEYDGVFDSKIFAMDKLKEQEQQEELLKTNKTINDIQTALQKAKKLDINTRVEEKQLDTVKEKITQGSLSVALEFANKCKNSLEQKINEYKKAAERSNTKWE